MAKTNVTITVSNDPSALGDAATATDLAEWAENVRLEVASKFGVGAHLVWGSNARSIVCDNAEVDSWLRELTSGDDWMCYL